MGMSTCVILLRDKAGPRHQQYLKVLLACQEAGIDPPHDVDMYFGGDGIDGNPDMPLVIPFEPREWKADMEEGYEVDLDDLPDGVKTIRFVNSW